MRVKVSNRKNYGSIYVNKEYSRKTEMYSYSMPASHLRKASMVMKNKDQILHNLL